MKKLYKVKKGNKMFYVCAWDCGAYSIERITKSVGCYICFLDTLEEIEKFINENGYKKIK